MSLRNSTRIGPRVWSRGGQLDRNRAGPGPRDRWTALDLLALGAPPERPPFAFTTIGCPRFCEILSGVCSWVTMLRAPLATNNVNA
jgi:hypothetical protein